MVDHPESALARLEAKVDDLGQCLARLEDPERHRDLPVPPSILNIPGKRSQRLPAFWNDLEVRQWAAGHLYDGSLTDVHAAAVRRFGEQRAPSRSALHRYRLTVRKAMNILGSQRR